MNFRRSTIILSITTLSVLLLVRCMHQESHDSGVVTEVSGWDRFAGSASCEGCHRDIYQHHLKTAHYLTSRPPIEQYIRGNFTPGKNNFYFNDGVKIAMEKRDSSFYQVKYIDGIEKLARRFDIIFGSGKKGQTFLNWYNNILLQLPITYFTATGQWSNSPGFPDKAVYNRPVTSRCMECHTTYAYKISDDNKLPEEFNRNKIVYGVDCEKCHGAAAAHVRFQTEHPQETKAKYIVNPASLSRRQNIDMCALCHGGSLSKTKPSFTFGPGDTLSKYFLIDTVAKDANDIDVHGNQYGLLAASKCFKNSSMTCSSCHIAHESETGNLALFSQRCMNCHNSGHVKICKITSRIGASIALNCIDCHMPEQPSRAIAVLLQGATSPTPALMRSHYIKIYNDETNKLLPSFFKRQKADKSNYIK
jgi:hypothetical protein